MKPLRPDAYPPMTAYQARMIEGPRQVTEQVDCESETTWVPTGVVQWHIDVVAAAVQQARTTGDVFDTSRHLRRADAVLLALAEELRHDAEHILEAPCDWTGDVDVAHHDTGRYTSTTQWSCPRCGATHEGEVDLTDDAAEYARDLRDDR